MPTVADALRLLDDAINLAKAADWDPVGLQVGDRAAALGVVAVCHEVTPEVIAAVTGRSVGLLVSYHPLLFEATKAFTAGSSPTGRAFELARNDTALYVVHTAFDVAAGGCADALADELGLVGTSAFGPVRTDEAAKIATVVPSDGATESHQGLVGRIGTTQERLAVGELAELVAGRLSSAVLVAGDPSRLVSKVSVVPGSGSDLIGAAAEAGADVIVTGDVSHHKAREAIDRGLVVIDAGHAATERPGVARLYSLVSQMFETVIDLTELDPTPWVTAR